MKLANVHVILIFLLIKGGRSQAPPELQCYSCITGDPGPIDHTISRTDCGDFGPLTPIQTCARGAACMKESAKNGEWTVHTCEFNDSMWINHGRDGCWKRPLSLNRTDYCRHCRCSTDL